MDYGLTKQDVDNIDWFKKQYLKLKKKKKSDLPKKEFWLRAHIHIPNAKGYFKTLREDIKAIDKLNSLSLSSLISSLKTLRAYFGMGKETPSFVLKKRDKEKSMGWGNSTDKKEFQKLFDAYEKKFNKPKKSKKKKASK